MKITKQFIKQVIKEELEEISNPNKYQPIGREDPQHSMRGEYEPHAVSAELMAKIKAKYPVDLQKVIIQNYNDMMDKNPADAEQYLKDTADYGD